MKEALLIRAKEQTIQTLGVYAGFGPYYGNPQIVEVVVMSSVATTNERDNMKNYVSARYGIAM